MSRYEGGRGRGSYRGFDNNRGDFGGGGRGDHRGGGGPRGGGRGDSCGGGGPRGGGRGDHRGGGGPRGGGGGDDRGRGGPRGGVRGDSRGDGGFRGRRDVSKVYQPPGGQTSPPSKEVTQVEDAYQRNLVSSRQASAKFPQRPGYGTQGRSVVLYANYFPLMVKKDMVLYRYNVDVSPEVVGKKLSHILKLFFEFPAWKDSRHDMVTDYKSTIITRVKIEGLQGEHAIQYRSEGEEAPKIYAKSYQIRVQSTGDLSMVHLVEYLSSTDASPAHYAGKPEIIQALNIFLSHYAKSKPSTEIAIIGSNKSYSLASEQRPLGLGLIALRGFFSSVRAATARILVNVNVSHAAFYTPENLKNLMTNSGLQGNPIKLQSFLKGVRVKTNHLGDKNKIKTIAGLANQSVGGGENRPRVRKFGASAKEVSFFCEQNDRAGQVRRGQYMSVWDFFNKHHRRSLASELPVVNVGNQENPIYLPPEVCDVLPGQSSNSKLNEQQTTKMIGFAVRNPCDNANSIVGEASQAIGLLPRDYPALGRFSINIVPQLITVSGRVLRTPQVQYSHKQTRVDGGSWNLTNVRFKFAVTMGEWSYLNIQHGRTIENIGVLMDMLQQQLVARGIRGPKWSAGTQVAYEGPDNPNLRSLLETKFRASPQTLGKPRIILVILPDGTASTYNLVKQVGDVELGIHTICVRRDRFCKGAMNYFANLTLKFNLKLGGINHTIERSSLGILEEDKTMVLGIDVTHPSPGSASNAPSVASMVASIDKDLAQWPADLRIQSARQEMVSDLEGMLKARLQLWKTRGQHRSYPENLLIYRDGVSEGQYQLVLTEELPLLRKACTQLYSAQETKKGIPYITIIIVGKRHNSRFYPSTLEQADSKGNPPNGTIVDRGVTEARNWDFFLQAHTALNGTARPAHYYVILDEIFIRRRVPPQFKNVADVIEDLTHTMSYVYGRATKAVSICTPAYYADVVCTRARCYLGRVFGDESSSASFSQGAGPAVPNQFGSITVHEALKNTMFYI